MAVGFLLLRAIDDRFKIIAPMGDCLEDLRSSTHTKHSLVQMVRQRVYQIAAGYEDCDDADYLQIDPARRLALGKDHQAEAGQSRLSRLENDVLGNTAGCLPQDNLVIKKETFRVYTREEVSPKPFLTAVAKVAV
jgi:hypothetical protein